MRYLSLFSGIGGFEIGINKAYENNNTKKSGVAHEEGTEVLRQDMPYSPGGDGGQPPTCIGYSEIDPYAIKIYQKHFPEHKNYGDITTINATELPDFDLLVGGFPCQAFSIAGKRRGFDDTRGTLFFDIARILKEKRPRNFILENVKGLLSHDNGNTFKTIISTLIELGYCVEWQVLNAKNFGVPQNRERVFIVGHFGREPERKVFPIGENDRENNGLPRYISNTLTARYEGAQATGTYIGEGELDAQETKSGGQSLQQEGTKPHDSDSRGGSAHSANPRIRRLTLLECERLMGYPDGWTEGLSDTQRYKTLGNGIVSNVVEEVVKRLLV